MKMTFRWYGRDIDPIPLKYIKQIPGMTGLMGLLDKPAGVDWPEAEFAALKKEVNEAGLEIEVIESVNVHEDIKMGLPSREEYIANYISTIRMLARQGVKVIIYNFMPVFDWLRTDLARVIPEDGSNSLYFDEKDLGEMGPLEIVRKTAEDSQGFTLPGWEPERLALLETTLKQYENIGPDDLRKNFKYFLDAVIPATRTTPHGPSSGCRGSPTARRTSTRWSPCTTAPPTPCACAPGRWDRTPTTTSPPSSGTLGP